MTGNDCACQVTCLTVSEDNRVQGFWSRWMLESVEEKGKLGRKTWDLHSVYVGCGVCVLGAHSGWRVTERSRD